MNTSTKITRQEATARIHDIATMIVNYDKNRLLSSTMEENDYFWNCLYNELLEPYAKVFLMYNYLESITNRQLTEILNRAFYRWNPAEDYIVVD